MDGHAVRQVADVAAAAHEQVVEAVRGAVEARGRAVLCLPGGRTPLPLYRALAARVDLPWRRVWLLAGDERWVAPHHSDRNERAMDETLLAGTPIPEAQVLRWPWQEGMRPERSAADFEARLRAELDPQRPFDLTLLGLGADGHTAGLFPGTGGTRAPGWTTVTRPASQATARLTLTPRALSRSGRVTFLASGEEKLEALRALVAPASPDDDPEARPARAVQAQERLEVLTDLVL